MIAALPASAEHRTDISIFVRQLRHLLDLTQAEFAEKLGVSTPTIARWETNKSHPSPLALMQLKNTLHQLKESPYKVQQLCAQALLAGYFDEDL
ncbi:MAG TPA: helix-turn-helix transcriptional regulator [Thermosynechococcaceae cyanobacterium]|jgi:putative transcriptional regulator